MCAYVPLSLLILLFSYSICKFYLYQTLNISRDFRNNGIKHYNTENHQNRNDFKYSIFSNNVMADTRNYKTEFTLAPHILRAKFTCGNAVQDTAFVKMAVRQMQNVRYQNEGCAKISLSLGFMTVADEMLELGKQNLVHGKAVALSISQTGNILCKPQITNMTIGNSEVTTSIFNAYLLCTQAISHLRK